MQFAKLSVIFLMFASFAFAQDAKQDEKKEKSEEERAKEIVVAYKNTVVDVDTTVVYENGSKGGWSGSGFFIDNEGHLLTNCHVARSEEKMVIGRIEIMLPKVAEYTYWITMVKEPADRKYEAKLVGWNKYVDLAILKVLNIEEKDYKPAKLGNSDKVESGQRVYAYGNPYGLANSFTGGQVSALHRYLNLNYIEDFIQTDAPINPGNSGSPLINLNGEVIGVNAAGYRGADGLGFAIPINLADIPRLKKGEVKIGYLGAEPMLDNFARTGIPGFPGFQDVRYLHDSTGVEDLKSLELLANHTWDRWALVLSLDNHDSPAEKAGLKRGDLVTHYNGKAVKSGRDVRLLMLDVEPEKEFEVKVMRVEKGAFKELTLKVSLAKEKKAGK